LSGLFFAGTILTANVAVHRECISGLITFNCISKFVRSSDAAIVIYKEKIHLAITGMYYNWQPVCPG